MTDQTDALRDAVVQAAAAGTPLSIVGGGSKNFYGRTASGQPLALAGHRGIVRYEPTELFVTARAGTPLREIEATLAERGQMLGFEPPHFGASATLGGAIACGLSGPRRPYAGAARDFVLGVRLLNGNGEVLRFGGEVMKNVAGYDVSRLMVGALGTLGVLLDLSLKVLPRPALELTLVQTCSSTRALTLCAQWSGQPHPVSATAWVDGALYVRLSGAASAVRTAAGQVGGEPVADGAAFWLALREQTHPFFAGAAPLWRIAVPPATPPLDVPDEGLWEWGGAQRWLRGDISAATIRAAAAAAGGHATLFRGGDRRGEVFHPLSPKLLELHRRLKQSFDPHGLFNPGRLYPDF